MEWLKIAIRRNTLVRAVDALLASSTNRHEEARRTKDEKRALELRKEGDADAEAHNEIWGASHEGAVMHDSSVRDNAGPVQITKIELPEKVERTIFWVIPTMVSFMMFIGACGVVIGLDIAERARMEFEFNKLDRQYRMTELKLDDWTVVAHRAGLQLPGDYTRGPQGNLDAESFNNRRK